MAISQNLQPQEVDFLKFQKKRGVDAKQAFEKLTIARDRGLFTKGTSALTKPDTPKAPGKLDFLETGVSEKVTAIGKELQEGAISDVAQATGKEIPFTEESKLAENFIPSAEKAFGSLLEVAGSPIDSVVNLGKTLKSVFMKGAENSLLLGSILESSEGDKAIQEVLEEGATKLKTKISDKGFIPTFNKAIQEDPFLLAGMLTSGFKKLGRAGGLSDKEQLKVDQLIESAESDVEKFLKPTKEKTKEITDKITGEIIERDIQGTRKEVQELAKAEVKRLDTEIDEFITSDKFTGEIDISKLTDELNKFEDKLIEPKSGLVIPGNEADFRFIVDTREFLEDLAIKTGNTLSADQSQFLKKSFNQVFKGNITSLEKFQNSVKAKLGLTLRDELAKDNPTLNTLNKDFSFWISLDNVLSETIKRTKGQAEGGGLETKASTTRRDIGKAGGAAVGGTIGGAIAGTEGAIAGAALGSILGLKVANKIDVVASSPKYKLVSAQKKKALADAIAEQNAGKVEKILDGIILAQGIEFIGEPAE